MTATNPEAIQGISQDPFDHIDVIWDNAVLRDRMGYEGCWFDAYRPAAVDAVSRRYQFWECEHGNPKANVESLANRPRVELTEEFRKLAKAIVVLLTACFPGPQQNPLHAAVLWSRLVNLKWEERKLMMDYVQEHTAMSDPLLPWPELANRPQSFTTPHGVVMVKLYRDDDYAFAWIEEFTGERRGFRRCYKIEQPPSESHERREAEAKQFALELAEQWAALRRI